MKLPLFLLVPNFVLNVESLSQDCSFAPLCGSQPTSITVEKDIMPDVEISSELQYIGGGSFEFGNCCANRDTLPTSSICQYKNPTGEHEREIVVNQPLCALIQSCDTNSTAVESSKFEVIIKSVFIRDEAKAPCCDTCSCFGALCRSFSGVDEKVLLCDARTVQTSPSGVYQPERVCEFTRDTCLSQVDHAGNQCSYMSRRADGSDWNVKLQGSPCQPNPNSPPAIITMYQILDGETPIFGVYGEQHERGRFVQVYVLLSEGMMSLTANDCIYKRKNSWIYSTASGIDFEGSFAFKEYDENKDVFWSISDPTTGATVSLRCFAVATAPDDGIYMPLINIESVSDPYREEREESAGFCSSDSVDKGVRSTEHSDWIDSNKYCLPGHDNQLRFDVYRAMCENPTLPGAHVPGCIESFCSRNYLPLYSGVDECVELFEDSEEYLGTAFCRAILFNSSDIEECLESWESLGAIPAIQSYLSSSRGCLPVATLSQSKTSCESGVTLQLLSESNGWEDIIFISEDFCGEEEIRLSPDDYPGLLLSNLRFVQSTAGAACSVNNVCKKTPGFYAMIALMGDLPTSAPTSGSTIL